MSINRVNISGNLTRDPELRATQGGMQVLGFGVAVNDRRRNQQTGEWEDYPNFVDCTMFGNRAESMGRILHKGMKVAIEGKLRYSSWDKDGQRRSKLEVIVDEIELMSQKQGQQAPQGYQQQYAPQPAPQAAPQQWNAQQAYQQAPATPQGYQQAPAQYAPQPAPQAAPQQWNAQQAYQQAPATPQGYQQAPAQYAPQPAPQAAPQQAPMPPAQESLYDGDIPF